MTTTAIHGGGFALYVYLPAVITTIGGTILVNEKHRELIEKRDDIRHFTDEIEFASEATLFATPSEFRIFAVTPQAQFQNIMTKYEFNSSVLLLEKPVAESPQRSRLVLDKLNVQNQTFTSNYIFRYCDWFRTLKEQNSENTSIIWKFRAHHIRNNLNNWKSQRKLGGGILRFYAIHLIAIAAELGFYDVVEDCPESSPTRKLNKLEVGFRKSAKTSLNIVVDCDCDETSFEILENGNTVFRRENPFDNVLVDGIVGDERIPLTSMHLENAMALGEQNEGANTIHELKIIELWERVESSVYK